jgi:hypothetical protein
MTPDRERELLERIRQLEELNSILQDKLDLIYEIVAPEDDEPPAENGGFVHIRKP